MVYFQHHLPQCVAVLTLLVVVLLVTLASINDKLNSTRRLVRGLLTGPDGEDLEAILKRCLNESRNSIARCDQQKQAIDALAETMRGCVQRVGMVRYDAFGDVSGSQSFSMALLDDNRNGAIVTSLLGRNDGRCFGKAISDGKSEQALSTEEAAALRMALDGTFAASLVHTSEKPARRERVKTIQ